MSRILTLTQQNRKEGKRFVKFLIVGGIGFVVDAVVFNVCAHVFNLPQIVAQTFSFAAAIVSNFTWNRYWTYPDSRSKPVRRQLVQFTVVNLIGYGIRVIVFTLVSAPYHQLVAALPFVPLDPAQAAAFIEFIAGNLTLGTAVVTVLLWNFFVNRYWTYNDVS
jgi:putative flippase GtrA